MVATGLAPAAEEGSVDRNHEKELIAAIENAVILPEPVGDPLEPVNRGLWKLNQGVLRIAIQPSSKVYRYVVRPNVRRGIRDAGGNLNYPRNVVNNLLQKKWTGARDETYRFLLNSTAGLAGFFDVATPAGIPASRADFGQTFRDWGWRPKVYLMLPISGPSNERDAVGGLADRIVNPLTYFSPWSYLTLGFMYNDLTDTVDEYIRAARAEFDPYATLRYAWTISRESVPSDITPATEYDIPSIETLQSVFFRLRDPRFPERGEKREVMLESTGRELPFTLWLQKGQAPLVFALPGLGSHRISGGALAMAEVLYNAGFSVITVSSAYNYEFMQQAATTP
ncbi:MAG: MlaA family lipoprotein, partial [Limisphaerales bacterium]